MAPTVGIRPVAKSDDRSGFSCGEPAIDRFFQHYAAQSQFGLHLVVTYMALVEDGIGGFATVTVASSERASVPGTRLRRRKAPGERCEQPRPCLAIP